MKTSPLWELLHATGCTGETKSWPFQHISCPKKNIEWLFIAANNLQAQKTTWSISSFQRHTRQPPTGNTKVTMTVPQTYNCPSWSWTALPSGAGYVKWPLPLIKSRRSSHMKHHPQAKIKAALNQASQLEARHMVDITMSQFLSERLQGFPRLLLFAFPLNAIYTALKFICPPSATLYKRLELLVHLSSSQQCQLAHWIKKNLLKLTMTVLDKDPLHIQASGNKDQTYSTETRASKMRGSSSVSYLPSHQLSYLPSHQLFQHTFW